MRYDTIRAAIAAARRELEPGARIHLMGELAPDERDGDMRACTSPDSGESVVWHADTLDVTGGEWCVACGETDVEDGSA